MLFYCPGLYGVEHLCGQAKCAVPENRATAKATTKSKLYFGSNRLKMNGVLSGGPNDIIANIHPLTFCNPFHPCEVLGFLEPDLATAG